MAAAIGLASGLGYFTSALVATLVVLVSLGPLRLLAGRLLGRFELEEARIVVELRPEEAAADVLASIERMGGGLDVVEIDQTVGRRLLEMYVGFRREGRARGLAELERTRHVVKVRWRH